MAFSIFVGHLEARNHETSHDPDPPAFLGRRGCALFGTGPPGHSGQLHQVPWRGDGIRNMLTRNVILAF